MYVMWAKNNLITGNIIGYTLEGQESGCIFEAIVLDLCIGNTVTDNKVSVTGRSAIVCTGISGASYNVIKNNEAIDHQLESQLGSAFWGYYNVVEGNKFIGHVSLTGSNNVLAGNDIRYAGQQGSLVTDQAEHGGNFIGGMGPGAGNIIGADNIPEFAFGTQSVAGPYVRGNTIYCSQLVFFMSSLSKVAFTNNTVYTTPSVWEAFQNDIKSFGAASGNVRR